MNRITFQPLIAAAVLVAASLAHAQGTPPEAPSSGKKTDATSRDGSDDSTRGLKGAGKSSSSDTATTGNERPRQRAGSTADRLRNQEEPRNASTKRKPHAGHSPGAAASTGAK